MMWGLYKLTDGEGQNENGRRGKRKMRATESERKNCHTAKRWTMGDYSSVDYISCSICLFPFLSPSLSLPLLSLHPSSVFQSGVTGRCHLTRWVPGLPSLRKWGQVPLTCANPPSKINTIHTITNEIHSHLFFPPPYSLQVKKHTHYSM